MRLFPSLNMLDNQLFNFLIGGTTGAVRDIFQLVHDFGGDAQGVMGQLRRNMKASFVV